MRQSGSKLPPERLASVAQDRPPIVTGRMAANAGMDAEQWVDAGLRARGSYLQSSSVFSVTREHKVIGGEGGRDRRG